MGLELKPDPLVKTADNFCAQARYLVHVTFAILQRNGRSHHFLQKNTMFSAHFPSKTDLAHQLPPESWEMPNIEELFRSYPSNELIHFHNNLKKWLFPIFVFLVTFFHIQANFYRKPKWSVWSIWTYSTRRISKLVTQKVSFWGKLKIEGFEKLKKNSFGSFWGSKWLLQEGFRDQNDF